MTYVKVRQQSPLHIRNRIVAKETKSGMIKKPIDLRKNLFITVYNVFDKLNNNRQS